MPNWGTRWNEMSEDTFESTLLTRIWQHGQAKSVELERCFLTEMTAARLSPQRQRKLIARYAEKDFYIQAKTLLARMLVSNQRWEVIEEEIEREIQRVARKYARHPLARDKPGTYLFHDVASLGDVVREDGIVECIKRSSERYQILRCMHQIRHAKLPRQALLDFLDSWTEASGSEDPPVLLGTAKQNVPAPTAPPPPQVPVAVKINSAAQTKKKRGRKSKFPPERIAAAQVAKDAGQNNEQIAQTLYQTKTPTDKQRRSVSTVLKYWAEKKSTPPPSKN
jgi:hypothetical protein